MSQPFLKSEGGFTLVEVMVAIMIMMVGMFGLLETLNASIQHNLKNQYRDEAVRIGARYMTELRGKRYAAYSSVYATKSIPTAFKGAAKNFTVERSTQPLATDSDGPTSQQLMVTVKWAFRNRTSVNRVVTVVGRPS